MLAVVVLSLIGTLDRSGLAQFAGGRSPLWLTGLVGVTVLLVLPALAAIGAWLWMYAMSDEHKRDIEERSPERT